MPAIKISLCTALSILIGINSAEAVSKLTPSTSKSHAEVTVGLKTVTLSSQQISKKSRVTITCSAMQGLAYGAALVGIQSTLIVLPSFASGVGVPVGSIATSVGVVVSGVGFVTMVVHDMACK